MEGEIMDREINRMKKIDRIKVNYANDLFINSDTKSILPSINKCQISKTTLNKNLEEDKSFDFMTTE